MAVQKSRTTPSKRGMRRGHDKLSSPALSTEATTGEIGAGETVFHRNLNRIGFLRLLLQGTICFLLTATCGDQERSQ